MQKFSFQKAGESSPGFTIIETIVYLGLFGLVMAGIIMAAYNMFELSGKTQTKAMVTAEGNFLLAKINSALTGASSVSQPASGSSGDTLSLTKSGTNIIFSLSGANNLEMKNGSNPVVTLNNSNVSVIVPITAPTFIFTHTGTGGAPEYITARFTLQTKTPNGQSYSQDFTTTKYLRK